MILVLNKINSSLREDVSASKLFNLQLSNKKECIIGEPGPCSGLNIVAMNIIEQVIAGRRAVHFLGHKIIMTWPIKGELLAPIDLSVGGAGAEVTLDVSLEAGVGRAGGCETWGRSLSCVPCPADNRGNVIFKPAFFP